MLNGLLEKVNNMEEMVNFSRHKEMANNESSGNSRNENCNIRNKYFIRFYNRMTQQSRHWVNLRTSEFRKKKSIPPKKNWEYIRVSKYMGQHQMVQHTWRRKEKSKCLRDICWEWFKIDERHQPTNPKSSENSNEKKYKGHSHTHHVYAYKCQPRMPYPTNVALKIKVNQSQAVSSCIISFLKCQNYQIWRKMSGYQRPLMKRRERCYSKGQREKSLWWWNVIWLL